MIMLDHLWRRMSADHACRPANSIAKLGAGRAGDGGDDALGHSVDLLVGQRPLAGLQADGDGDGFLALAKLLGRLLAREYVEHIGAFDQLFLGRPVSAEDVAGLDALIDDKGEVAPARAE